jgi:hypothetical protein
MSLCCCKLDQEPSWLSLGALRTSLILKWSGGIPTFSGYNFTLNTDWSSHEIPKVDPATKREKSRWPTVRAFRHFRFADGVFGLGSRVSANKQANMGYEHATHTHTCTYIFPTNINKPGPWRRTADQPTSGFIYHRPKTTENHQNHQTYVFLFSTTLFYWSILVTWWLLLLYTIVAKNLIFRRLRF